MIFLSETAVDFGIELSDKHLELFSIYIDELIQWNRRINLTGLSTRKRIITELLLDSLIPSPFIPEEGRMLDVGSGAGFPGMVLKIYRPNLNIHLLEINSKKVSFLKQVIRLLKLPGIEVIKGRIERGADCLDPEGYHLITSRALASLDKIIDWCSPYLAVNGQLVTFLGSMAETDIMKSREKRAEKSLYVHKSIPYSLPEKGGRRTIVILKKRIL